MADESVIVDFVTEEPVEPSLRALQDFTRIGLLATTCITSSLPGSTLPMPDYCELTYANGEGTAGISVTIDMAKALKALRPDT